MKRFYDKISKCKETGCWNWTGALIDNRYGVFRFDGRNVLAHRMSFLLHVEDIPDGKQVAHFCHNTRCINPDHLHICSSKNNQQDKRSNGTYRTKFSEEDYRRVFELSSYGFECRAIGDKLGMGASHVSRILNRKCV